MVKSGLEEPSNKFETPRVSPYRLATHLTSAFVIYTGLLWTALNVASPVALADRHLAEASKLTPVVADQQVAALRIIRQRIHPLAGLVAITAISGAFVAGMDAGKSSLIVTTADG